MKWHRERKLEYSLSHMMSSTPESLAFCLMFWSRPWRNWQLCHFSSTSNGMKIVMSVNACASGLYLLYACWHHQRRIPVCEPLWGNKKSISIFKIVRSFFVNIKFNCKMILGQYYVHRWNTCNTWQHIWFICCFVRESISTCLHSSFLSTAACVGIRYLSTILK